MGEGVAHDAEPSVSALLHRHDCLRCMLLTPTPDDQRGCLHLVWAPMGAIRSIWRHSILRGVSWRCAILGSARVLFTTMATVEGWELEPAGSSEISAERAMDFDMRFHVVRRRLIGICSALVGRDEAEDVVQDTYLAGRSRYARLRDPTAFEAWVIRIAFNRCMDRHRRGSRIETLGTPERTPSRASRDAGLRELIEQLPPRERTTVVLHYGYGYQLDEIGRLLDLSHTNVRTIIARARQRLLRAWREAES
jgi:RNA polymerase sigma-70 factor (ECF subfamily)